MKLVLLRIFLCTLAILSILIVPALGFCPNEIAIVYNTNSSIVNASQGVALYYAQVRGVPQQNLIGFITRTSESMTATQYLEEIATPISNYLSTHPNIKVIVLCYGIPTTVFGTPYGSVDSALMLLGNFPASLHAILQS